MTGVSNPFTWIVTCIIIWLVWKVHCLEQQNEGFAEVDLNPIKEYNTFAKTLKQGGVTVPGNINFSGDITVGGNATVGNRMLAKEVNVAPDKWGGWHFKVAEADLVISYAGLTNKRAIFRYHDGLQMLGGEANAKNIDCGKITASKDVHAANMHAGQYNVPNQGYIRGGHGKLVFYNLHANTTNPVNNTKEYAFSPHGANTIRTFRMGHGCFRRRDDAFSTGANCGSNRSS